MIVCHCEVLTDRDVADAIQDGACSIAKVCAATGAGRNCGGCVLTLKRLLCQHDPISSESILGVDRAAGQSTGSGVAQQRAHV